MSKKLTVEEFIAIRDTAVVLDVRSPSEYKNAHIPGAQSLPLFTDEERAVVGTLYKQRSREDAIKAGLDFFGPKMRGMVEQVEAICPQKGRTIVVHCWRGGMRSAAVAWLLELYGFTICTISGGYKAFRNWVLGQFAVQRQLNVVGGYTGSGKTGVLHALKAVGHSTIDLEGLAQHKGSAFGGFRGTQPRQEMFENLLAVELNVVSRSAMPIWIEDESQRIGLVNIPAAFWVNMRQSPLYFLNIPFDDRLNHVTEEYGQYSCEELVNATIRIQKKLGGLDAKNAVYYLMEGNKREGFSILLRYYDKGYLKALHKRENLQQLMIDVPVQSVDPILNAVTLAKAAQLSL